MPPGIPAKVVLRGSSFGTWMTGVVALVGALDFRDPSTPSFAMEGDRVLASVNCFAIALIQAGIELPKSRSNSAGSLGAVTRI